MNNDLEDRIRSLIENTRYGAMSASATNDTMDAVQYAAEDFIITRDMLEQYPIYIVNTNTNNITTSNITTPTASAVSINNSAYYFADYERIKMENEIIKRKLAKSLGIDIDKKQNNDWEVEI